MYVPQNCLFAQQFWDAIVNSGKNNSHSRVRGVGPQVDLSEPEVEKVVTVSGFGEPSRRTARRINRYL
jgi:hypothetical protein